MSEKKEKENRKRIRAWAVAHAENVRGGGPGIFPAELLDIPRKDIIRQSEKIFQSITNPITKDK